MKHSWSITAVGVIIAGIVMRVVALGTIPYGIYHDEAFYGLDALSVLAGEHQIYFPENNGREPLHIYLMAGSIGVLGGDEVGLRAASALVGITTLAALYLLGRAWTNPRVGLLTGAIGAGLLWHVHFSRIAFRAISLPLMLALAAGCGAMALRQRSMGWAAAAGVALGLGVYTYVAVRLVPFILLGWLLYGLVVQRAWLWDRRREVGVMIGVTALVVLPFALFALNNPAVVFERVGQVGVWNAGAQEADPSAGLLPNLWATLGMFNVRGDGVWRHNVAGRPVFGPVMGVLFVMGVVQAAHHKTAHKTAYRLALIWIGVMLVATLLTIQAPSFLRTIGAIPAVVLLPALVLDEALERWSWAPLAVAGVLVLHTGLTGWAYFGCHTLRVPRCIDSAQARAEAYQAEATELADRVRAAPAEAIIPQGLYTKYPSLRFLLPEATLYVEGDPLAPRTPPVTVFAWPYEGIEAVRAALPAAPMRVHKGSLMDGGAGGDPFYLYVELHAAAAAPPPTESIRFSNGLTLHAAHIDRRGDRLTVSMTWGGAQAAPAQVFVHLRGADGDIRQQVDEPPGTVFFTPGVWPADQPVTHEVSFRVPPGEGVEVVIGLYDPLTGERFASPAGDSLRIGPRGVVHADDLH